MEDTYHQPPLCRHGISSVRVVQVVQAAVLVQEVALVQAVWVALAMAGWVVMAMDHFHTSRSRLYRLG